MNQPIFGGDKKVGASVLHRAEQAFIHWMVPKVPLWIGSRMLTLFSIPISASIILCSYLAATFNLHWLWAVSILIALQWLTDSLDGSVGRTRGEGLVKWGFYMDHFLDYIFLCAILIGYMLLVPDQMKYVQFFVLAVGAAFMVHSFLAFGATNEFRIVHMGIGPTELRLVFIAINSLIIFFGKTYLAATLPYILAAAFCGLCIVVYHTQKRIYQIDMDNKNRS